MKIKILYNRDVVMLETEYNKFCQEHDVRYTQSHVESNDDAQKPLKYLFVYYEEYTTPISKLIGRGK